MLVPAVTFEQRALVVLLRIGGGITILAFLAMVMPTSWMAATHAWLGLGEFPRVPVVDYLTRSVAAIYGFHGVLVLVVSSDPVRYIRIVRYLGVMNILLGLFLLAIDLHAGMPPLWTLTEGPPIAIYGGLILYLARRL